MKNKTKYKIVKRNNKEQYISFNLEKIDGFNLTKERKKVINGVTVNKLIVVNKKFIDIVIEKKVSKKVKSFLELLAKICESDDETGSAMNSALTEVERFKRIVQNEYYAYMQKKQLEILSKKIKLIENELKVNLYKYSKKNNMYLSANIEPKEEEIEKSGHRRR